MGSGPSLVSFLLGGQWSPENLAGFHLVLGVPRIPAWCYFERLRAVLICTNLARATNDKKVFNQSFGFSISEKGRRRIIIIIKPFDFQEKVGDQAFFICVFSLVQVPGAAVISRIVSRSSHRQTTHCCRTPRIWIAPGPSERPPIIASSS